MYKQKYNGKLWTSGRLQLQEKKTHKLSTTKQKLHKLLQWELP